MINTLKPNKYKGHCLCGETVSAGAGYFRDGIVFCETPNDLNHCPTYQRQCDDNETQRKLRDQEWRDSLTQEQWDQFYGRTSDDNTCVKCLGDGRYHFASGVSGECYQCNGSGKIQ